MIGFSVVFLNSGVDEGKFIHSCVLAFQIDTLIIKLIV